ncbi:MAG: peptide-methionine (R)-S-oxide reductase [Deltaproteobacteria bacterium]|nr:peptide-methionine (R)-S-oxide reductase [Deltaproteobacteria bacterium]
MSDSASKPAKKTNEEWKKVLSAEQYAVTREAGTEPPFTGEYCSNKQAGVYRCICCGANLFSSETKYESHSGWPSYWKPVGESAVAEHTDQSHGMVRTEVTCSTCDAHLGHVFPDGPKPTGLRYCINSLSLDFKEGEES